MNTRIAVLAALACSLTPLASEASAPQAALDACVKAFTTTYLPGHALRATRTVSSPSTLMLIRPTEYSIALSARGVTSGKILAEARCVANGKGLVLVLDQPTENYTAQADFVFTLR